MKILMTIGTIVLSLLFMTGCDKETVIPEQNVPTEIKNYVSSHFSSCSISKAIKETDENDEMYEITLSCAVKLEFNKQKEIIDIDGTTKLPDSVIPSNILSYVNSNYATNFIIGWELQSGNQEVQLNNNLVLIFNMAGELLRVED
ncbi:MAG: PepSY-like domain-containing protein [Ferruginibacter sp.]|nr:PepSY-like domain-containing protein [Bacteroidota bacterium]MCW5917076.1 PepSY-like domain-containing protein [Ferruginibacter sp.]